jgi:hypothetical protein
VAKSVSWTINVVVAQKSRPAKWVIVSGGSIFDSDLRGWPLDRFSLLLNAA